MRIETFLGLQPGGPVLAEAAAAWPGWRVGEPGLPEVELSGLPGWLASQDPVAVDGVLLTLARLGSPSGGDNPVAASVLAWLLLPGAGRLARDLGPGLAGDVALQLWVACRDYPWQRRPGAVAVNVLRDLRRTVLRAYDLTGRSVLMDPHHDGWLRVPAPEQPEPPSWERLLGVLAAARDSGRVGEDDIGLVVLLAQEAHARPGGARQRAGGLMCRDVSEQVGARVGRSGRTVRRRARATVSAIAEVAGQAPVLVGAR